jgi:hypothetical protein
MTNPALFPIDIKSREYREHSSEASLLFKENLFQIFLGS